MPIFTGSGRDGTPKPWRVIAVDADGRRVLAGRFETRRAADAHAALLRPIAAMTGGEALVEAST
jgi:hypothetical protein